jgi:nicotinamide mononucleotide adenylyltransferase
MKAAVFSGRFDPPNLGHVLTISRILHEFDIVIVPVLDYHGRGACTADEAVAIFNETFDRLRHTTGRRPIFLTNKVHFADITATQYLQLIALCNVPRETSVTYLSGNREVLANFKRMGLKHRYVVRVTIPQVKQQVFASSRIKAVMNASETDLKAMYNVRFEAKS